VGVLPPQRPAGALGEVKTPNGVIHAVKTQPMTNEPDTRATKNPLNVPAGPRFTSNPAILRHEEELDTENPARPLADSTATVEELREEVADEAASDDPDRQRISVLNQQIKAIQDNE